MDLTQPQAVRCPGSFPSPPTFKPYKRSKSFPSTQFACPTPGRPSNSGSQHNLTGVAFFSQNSATMKVSRAFCSSTLIFGHVRPSARVLATAFR